MVMVDNVSHAVDYPEDIEIVKKMLKYNKSKKSIENKVLSDSCEALIGAIYLDKGFIVVEKVILNLWSSNIKDSVVYILVISFIFFNVFM